MSYLDETCEAGKVTLENYIDEQTRSKRLIQEKFKWNSCVEDDIEAGDSASNVGKCSIVSSKCDSVRSTSSRNEAKMAALRIRAKGLETQHKIAKELAEMKYLQEKVKIETDLAAAEAEMSVVSNSRSNRDNVTMQQLPVINKVKHDNNVNVGKNDMTNLVTLMNLPKADLMKFDGDPLKYWTFVRSFDNCVGVTTVNDGVKLSYLLNCCTGRARNVIECCAVMDPTKAYTEARKLLSARFGHAEVISRAWVDKVTKGPPIKPGDGEALRDYADSLRTCQVTLQATGRVLQLDSRISMMVERLPLYLQGRWRQRAVQHLRSKGTYPPVSDLVNFLDIAADEANDPLFGPGRGQRGQRGPERVNRSTSHFQASPSQMLTCLVCKGNHLLYKCEQFKSFGHENRLNFIKDNKHCFNCFAKSHASYSCRHASFCRTDGCQKKHSNLLHHVLVADQGAETVSHSVGSTGGLSDSRVVLPIVPVVLKTERGNKIDTYAFLDNGSTNSFCSDELVKALGITGTPSSLSLTTLTNRNSRRETQCVSLTISDVKGSNSMKMPNVFVVPQIPMPSSCMTSKEEIKRWPHLRDIDLPAPHQSKVTILIGQDNPSALAPLDCRSGDVNGPYAVLTRFGWTINGPIGKGKNSRSANTYFTQMQPNDDDLKTSLERIWKLDQIEEKPQSQMSVMDKKVIEIWEKDIEMVDGHYSLPIPFKCEKPDLPDNYSMAAARLESLSRKLKKNEDLHKKYSAGISDLLEKGHAEKVTQRDAEGPVWYLPHHAVTSEKKPDKPRIVFDCSAKYMGTSLNEEVLQGPDLTNNLLGVLLRFRQDQVAVMGDIETMFHQVRVHKEHRNALRFLWWPGGDMSLQPEIYRMTVHLFGGIWSPSCANFAVKRTASDNLEDYCDETITTVKEHLYVDDCLKSVKSDGEATALVSEVCNLLEKGGFNITKWTSNSRAVLESIPAEKKAKQIKDIDICDSELPREKALGVVWDTETDSFGFTVNLKERNHTRRGIISIIGSVYDPFGFVCPVSLKAKTIFQDECRLKKDWDEPIEKQHEYAWVEWLQKLKEIENLSIPRCVIPVNFEHVKCEIHIFSDASNFGYGSVAYLRIVDELENIHCSFMLGKSRLAPIKQISIPRLELSAAVLSVKLGQTLKDELRLTIDKCVYWTDSMIVLQQIRSEHLRFQTFVGNRITTIREATAPEDWRHVESKLNPADHASRGLDADEILKTELWFKGPEFLWKNEEYWPNVDNIEIPVGDLEVKKPKMCGLTMKCKDCIDELFQRYSSWTKLKRAVCWILRFKKYLQIRASHKGDKKLLREKCSGNPLSAGELNIAETEIVRYVQNCKFSHEIEVLQKDQPVKRSSSILMLEPMLNDDGILCVGGRLDRAKIPEHSKHQAILPKDHCVVKLICEHAHHVLGHSGTEHMLAHLRQKFWVIKSRYVLKSIMRKCVHCCRMRGLPTIQKMSSLPTDRVTPGQSPFTYVGVDCFGPFEVKRGRSTEKRYGCLFTCLTMRAVHIEMLNSLDTDSFIQALRRFESRRGRPQKIRSDNGTNFRGAQRELKEEIQRWNQTRIQQDLAQRDITWEFNPPTASHMGGIWERQIRTVRKVLNGLLNQQHKLSDESLYTLFCEVESIINSRPITVVSDSVKDLEPLTPNHLLLLKSCHPVPPGVFKTTDVYSKRWRHVQHLADVFWKRWLHEYLPSLQLRQKWKKSVKNVCVGDIVLIIDENTPRKMWPLAKVLEVYPGKDGLVRSVLVRSRGTTLQRPVQKLCLLESVTEEEK